MCIRDSHITGHFSLENDPYLGYIISGEYDFGNGDWNNDYIVTDLLAVSYTHLAYAINADDEDVTVTLEASMDETGNMILGVTVPDVFKEDLIIVFKGTDMLFKKALVITPAN